MSKTRIDKWLWSVRIFKSRTKATDACKSGRVILDDKIAKASTEINENQIVKVRKNGFNLEFKVLKLIRKRVSSPLALECYENQTSQEELNKFNSWFIGKGRAEVREKGQGRPTKRERRTIESYKEDIFWEYLEDDDEDTANMNEKS